MIDYKTAIELILSNARSLPAQHVAMQHSLNRVLAGDVFYDTDMPPFNKSAMDGYACRKEDLFSELEVVETVHAGKLPERNILKNQCCKIMTGAMIPSGADFVFKKEDAQITEQGKVRCLNPDSPNSICYRGEDVKKGDKVLEKSTLITSRHLPLIAGAGIQKPLVARQPEVALFATGTELVEPHGKPMPFQIRNTNSSQLSGKLCEMNIPYQYGGILPDDKKLITARLTDALKTYQVILLTGGVSVGDFDLIPGVLNDLGFRIVVDSTAIKPGKPMIFACKADRYCFGLSGNPVSSFIQFELFVKSFLYALMGHQHKPAVFKLPLGKDLNREKSDRVNFIPAQLTPESEIIPVDFHGSAHINALAGAAYLIETEPNADNLKKGSLVNVRPL